MFDSLTCIYRISDNGNSQGKRKLKTATKEHCYLNFVKEFGKRIIVVADKCSPSLIEFIKSQKPKELIETEHGHVAGGFRTALTWAMDNLKDRHSFYMVEDDYLHLPGARSVLREGLKIGEYVTLYDHPDKYMKAGPNPHVINGAEKSQVFLSKSCHWKQTNSTTMTWATRVETLKQDREVWWANSEEKAAYDFEAFMSLDRLTISSIPGWSTHCETQWLTPLQDWKAL